jgi:hypothetical protein
MNKEVADYLGSLRAPHVAAGPMETLPELRQRYRDVIGSALLPEDGFRVKHGHNRSEEAVVHLLGRSLQPAATSLATRNPASVTS